MLGTRDVSDLFAQMRGSYGHLWPYTAEDIPVWLKKLGGYSREDVMRAANRATSAYLKHPPNVGQFDELVSGPAPRATTYREAPTRPQAMLIGNRLVLRNLMKFGGIDRRQLNLVVELKNALVGDFLTAAGGDDAPPSREWIEDVDSQLFKLAADHDPVARAREAEAAREQFCIKQGIRYVPVEVS